MSVEVKFTPETWQSLSAGFQTIPIEEFHTHTCDCRRAMVALKALTAKAVAAVEPILPRLAIFELLQTSYGAPELLRPGVSTKISMLTWLWYSGTPKKPAAKFSAVLTMRSWDSVRKTGSVPAVVKLLRSSPYS